MIQMIWLILVFKAPFQLLTKNSKERQGSREGPQRPLKYLWLGHGVRRGEGLDFRHSLEDWMIG